jgi:hypothetical protein
MNKTLFDKVKSLCKDTGLSEKYLKAITEKLGGSIEDDSTDEAAIETTANLVADVAKESQGESSRWVDAFKKKNPKRKDPDDDDDPDDDSDDDDDPDDDPDAKKKGKKDPMMKLLKKMQKQMEDQAAELKTLKGEKAAGERTANIQKLMEDHKIPKYLRDTLAKSIAEGDDAEETIKNFKQGLITNGLETEETEGKKVASEKQVDEAADSLLESITVK